MRARSWMSKDRIRGQKNKQDIPGWKKRDAEENVDQYIITLRQHELNAMQVIYPEFPGSGRKIKSVGQAAVFLDMKGLNGKSEHVWNTLNPLFKQYNKHIEGNSKAWSNSAKSLKRIVFRDNGIFQTTTRTKKGRQSKSSRRSKKYKIEVWCKICISILFGQSKHIQYIYIYV